MRREDRDDLVAVDDVPVLVDREHPVAVAVERDAEVEPAGASPFAAERARSVAPQPWLMFVPSGSAPIVVTTAPSCSNARGAISQYAPFAQSTPMLQARQVGAEALDDVLEVAVVGDADPVELAAAGRIGASSSASISSSLSSVSFCPSRSKNLTPLYSGGLCEAVMTAPRSSASSATAGVGSTPPSTAMPPAGHDAARERLLELDAGGARVAADEDAAAARPQRDGLAELLDELGRQALADDPAHTVGAEVATRHAARR